MCVVWVYCVGVGVVFWFDEFVLCGGVGCVVCD